MAWWNRCVTGGAAAWRAIRPVGRQTYPLLDASDWAEISHALSSRAPQGLASIQARTPNAGEGRSRLQGRGLDYAESRAYQAGDDMRAMHWSLLARTGKPYVRRYEEEHAAPWHALVDIHGRMRFGTRSRTKAAQAARAALLAAGMQAAAAPQSRLSCTLWTEQGLQGHSFGAGFAAVRRMAMWLMAQTIAPPEPLAWAADDADEEALDAWARRILINHPAPSRVVLCSDFAWFNGHTRSALWPVGAQVDLLAVCIADAVEVALPVLPLAHFKDGATGMEGWLETDMNVRERFSRDSQRRRDDVSGGLQSIRARVAPIPAHASSRDIRAELLSLMR